MRYPESKKSQAFLQDLASRVEREISHTSRKRLAPKSLLWRAIFLIILYWGTWFVLMRGYLSPGVALLACLLLGATGTSIALNIGHETCHATYFRRPLLNSILYWLSMNMLGISAYLWKQGHLKAHHPFSNVPGHDVGIDGGDLLRLGSQTPWRPLHRYQHAYAPIAYSVYTLSLIFMSDFRKFFGQKNIKGLRLLELILTKGVYLYLMLYLPWKYSGYSIGQISIGFLTMHAVLSLVIASALFSTHMSLEVEQVEPNSQGQLPFPFVEHQFATVCDYRPTSRLANALLGGFNAHLLHHFLPKMSSGHYPKLMPIFIQTAQDHGYHYRQTQFWRGIYSHLRFLKKMGQPPKLTQVQELKKRA